jgi:hypothetical protein
MCEHLRGLQAALLRCPLTFGANQVIPAQHLLSILLLLAAAVAVKADQVGVWLAVAVAADLEPAR